MTDKLTFSLFIVGIISGVGQAFNLRAGLASVNEKTDPDKRDAIRLVFSQ